MRDVEGKAAASAPQRSDLALHDLMSKPGFEYLGARGCLNYSAIKRVFISHQHADHIGGFPDVLEAYEVLHYGDPFYPHTSSMYANPASGCRYACSWTGVL